MCKKLFAILWLLCLCVSAQAMEITRYVSIGGTGDGLTPENPTADLSAMLSLSEKVDKLTLYVAPGFYSMNYKDNGEIVSFKNVILDGTWKMEDKSEKVRINFPKLLFNNSVIVNASFPGGVTIDGGTLYNCEADNFIGANFGNGDVQLIDCDTKSYFAEYYGYGRPVGLAMIRCSAEKGSYGLKAKNITNIYCKTCWFRNQSEGGIDIDNSMDCTFQDCQFGFNRGDGAARVMCFDNNAHALFSRCKFEDNDVTNNHSYNIYIYPDVTFENCLFANNTEKDIDHRGFICLTKPGFMFENCSFLNNKGGIVAEQYYPNEYQIQNCLFWNNGRTVTYAGGKDLPMLACAMDHGTGIPELDREKGIMILTEAAKGFSYYGVNVELEPSSPLINAGVPYKKWMKDLHKHPRNAFGGTDIGCSEFISAPGLWTLDDPQQKFEIAEGTYQLCKANFGGKDYYCLMPEYKVKDGDFDISEYFDDLLYLDTMPVKPTVHNGKYVETHYKNSKGTFDIVVYKPLQGGGFEYVKGQEYGSIDKRPQVKINGDEVEFITPTPAKATTQTRKTTTTTAKKATPTTGKRAMPKRPVRK